MKGEDKYENLDLSHIDMDVFIDFLKKLDISPASNVVLHVYSNGHYSQHDEGYVYYGTIKETAERVGVSKSTVQKVFKTMKDNGRIELVRNGVYRLNS